MSKSRKKQKQSKANEKDRLDRMKHPELFDENGERIGKKGKRKTFKPLQSDEPEKKVDHSTDSFGNSIPSEKERKITGEHADPDADVAVTETKTSAREFKTYANPGAKKSSAGKMKTKTRYVFTKGAKKALGIAAACVIVLVLAIAILINALNDASNDNDAMSSEQAMSLVSMTDSGKAIVDGFGKFDNMWKNDDGTRYANVYDTLITVDDARTLTASGQYPVEDGMFAYNEEHSSAAPLKKLREEATQAEKELADATANLTDEEKQQLQDAINADENANPQPSELDKNSAATPVWQR